MYPSCFYQYIFNTFDSNRTKNDPITQHVFSLFKFSNISLLLKIMMVADSHFSVHNNLEFNSQVELEKTVSKM